MNTEQEAFPNETPHNAAEPAPEALPVVESIAPEDMAAEALPAETPENFAEAAADDALAAPVPPDAPEPARDEGEAPQPAPTPGAEAPAEDTPGGYESAPDYGPEYEREYDVEAALAALTTLNELAAPAPADEAPEAPAYGAPPEGWHSDFRQPPLSALERGQAASVVPALLLVGVGVFFTMLLTSGLPLPAPDLVGAIALGAVGICLIAAWVSSGRWARGNLFMGVVCLVGGALLAIL